MRYEPSPAPDSASDVPRFLNQELARIAEAVNSMGGAGSLQKGVEDNYNVTTTFTKLTWDEGVPVRQPKNVQPDLPNDQLVIKREGLWIGMFWLSAEFPNGTFEAQIHVNDDPVGVPAVLNPPNNQILLFEQSRTGRIPTDFLPAYFDVRLRTTSGSRNLQVKGAAFHLWYQED